jgi:hypothetical protein
MAMLGCAVAIFRDWNTRERAKEFQLFSTFFCSSKNGGVEVASAPITFQSNFTALTSRRIAFCAERDHWFKRSSQFYP